VRPDPPRDLALLGEKPLIVPAAIEPDRRERYVTSLARVEARAANSDLVVWHSLPGTSDWRTAERLGNGILVDVDLAEVGVHLLSTAPKGTLPYYASAEIVVDRAPPDLEVRFERMTRSSQAGSHFRLRWRADDPHIRIDAVRIEWRDPATGEWATVGDRMKPSGALLWPYPAGEPAAHRIRVRAVDLGGNDATIEVELAEAFRRTVWRAGSRSAAPPAPPASSDAPSSPPSAKEGGAGRSPSAGEAAIPVAAISWPVRSGERIAGGARIPAPVRGPVHLLSPDGSSRPLEREGNLVLLPRESGSPYRLVAGGDRSPEFSLDATPPEARLDGASAGADAVTIAWSIADPSEPGGVRTLLRIEGEAGTLPPVELVVSPQRIPLDAGTYSLRLEARDALGNVAEGEPFSVQVGEKPPSVAELAGETIAGGRSRYLLLDPGAATGSIELRARPVAGGTPLPIAAVPASTRLVLWDVPPVDGEYELEIVWRDAAGEERVRRVTPPFSIDATPPRCEVRLAAREVRDSLAATLAGEEGIEIAGVHRRRLESEPWSALRDGWRILPGPGEPGLVRLEIDVRALEEGEWRLGATLRDARGLLLAEPIPFPPVVVDRTPPSWREPPRLPVLALEGVAPEATLRLAELPAVCTATWIEAAGERSLAVATRAEEEGASLLLPALPAGDGELRIRIADAAGNEATVAGTVSVRPALLAPIALLPAGTVVPPGDELFVEVPIDPEHPAGATAELRLVDAEGRARARWPLSRGRRASVAAPVDAGSYRFEAGPIDGDPYRGGLIAFQVDPSADPEAKVRELVIAVREWEERRDRAAAPAAPLEAERVSLVEELERELARDARRERVRRALARLHLRADPPRRDLAGSVLREGLGLPLPDPDRAALLNDLAVLTLESDPEGARELLRQAVELEPTAGRLQNLGDVALRLGRIEEATVEYAAAVSLDPSAEPSRERWARAAARLSPERRESARRTLSGWLERGIVDRATAERLWRTVSEGGEREW